MILHYPELLLVDKTKSLPILVKELYLPGPGKLSFDKSYNLAPIEYLTFDNVDVFLLCYPGPVFVNYLGTKKLFFTF